METLKSGSQEIPLDFLVDSKITEGDSSSSEESDLKDVEQVKGKEFTSRPVENFYEDDTGTCPATALTSEAPAIERKIPKIVITKVDDDESDSSSSSSEGVDMIFSPFLPLPENPNLNDRDVFDIRNVNSDSNEYFFNLIDSNDIKIKKEEPIKNEKKMQTLALKEKFTSFIDSIMNSFAFAF